MASIRQAGAADWQTFYALAADEGWRVPAIERRLFAGPWSGHARVLEADGDFCGLVTAVAYQRSGWIGNLIVPRPLRGKGYGVRLFQQALDDLAGRGIENVWLTASPQGQPIYEKAGFVAIGQIERWVSPTRQVIGSSVTRAAAAAERLRDFDQMVWGEDRQEMLTPLLAQGEVFACDDSVALLQAGTDVQIIGPWYSENACPRSNRLLLQRLLDAAEPAIEVVADVLVTSPLRQLLAAAAFACAGRTTLMVRGDDREIALDKMVSFASLGSYA